MSAMRTGFIILAIISIICHQAQQFNCSNVTELGLVNKLLKLKRAFVEITSSNVTITITDPNPNCVQMECKLVCFNGKAEEISADITRALSNSHMPCPVIKELRIYNYDFPDQKINRGFLEDYSSKVETLYIASSEIEDVESGAFANGTFTTLILENLKLTVLRPNFFQDISSHFSALSIIQKGNPLHAICADFLEYVKYQIKSLTLQVGITCARNMTAADNLLNNLAYVDFSFNNFGDGIASDTFCKLSMVEHFDLSHANISYLPAYVFSDFLDTLLYLDLSYNHLTTLSRTVFGWRELPRELKIMAENNDWECSCQLKKQMTAIFSPQAPKLFCQSPAEYYLWSVFDDNLCDNQIMETSSTQSVYPSTQMTTSKMTSTTLCWSCFSTSATPSQPTKAKSTTLPSFSTQALPTTGAGGGGGNSDNGPVDGYVRVHCKKQENPNDAVTQVIKARSLEFVITPEPNSRVVVTVKSEAFNESHSLVWFSKVTSEYYKMEINYKEYGLGCFNRVPAKTVVTNLVPNVAYTFCLVPKGQLTVSPFNCKSVHMSGNLVITYSAWLTRDMRVTGVSLLTLGIIIFTFFGVLTVFFVLKRKPTLIKGSKRIVKSNGNSGDIIVFPKDKTVEDFKHKEEMLANRFSNRANSYAVRRSSTVSMDSNQSYMNANLYEELPAYLTLGEHNQTSNYLTPMPDTNADDSINYAEIPYFSKNITPEKQQEPHQLELGRSASPVNESRNWCLVDNCQV